jgi:hypothetical protein
MHLSCQEKYMLLLFRRVSLFDQPQLGTAGIIC